MASRLGILLVVLLATLSTVRADTLFHVAVDTSSISGTTGAIDFNFDPGPSMTQAAMVKISNFGGNGTLAGNCPCGIGDVSGQLPGIVSIDNGTGFNDYFDGYLFGTTLIFDLSYLGPAVSSPDGTSTSESSFVLSLFSDSAGTIPTLTSDSANGFTFRGDLNLDGTVTITNFSPQTTVTPQTNSTPEPNTLMLTLPVIVFAGVLARKRRLAVTRCCGHRAVDTYHCG
jgi:hypothetical protein